MAAVYRVMPPAAVPAKKANPGVAEKAFETNCRSAPFLFLGESAPVLFRRLTNMDGMGFRTVTRSRVSSFIQTTAVNGCRLEMRLTQGVAGVEDFQIAEATYEAARKLTP